MNSSIAVPSLEQPADLSKGLKNDRQIRVEVAD